MSASRGNYIGLAEPPEVQFGKTMRIPDGLLDQWWTLIAERPPPPGDPLESKLALARLIVTRSWGEEAARAAEEHFTRVVRRGEAPEDVPDVPLPSGDPVHLPALLADGFGIDSRAEARRLIQQGGGEAERRARGRRRPAAGRPRRRAPAGRQAAFRPPHCLSRQFR